MAAEFARLIRSNDKPLVIRISSITTLTPDTGNGDTVYIRTNDGKEDGYRVKGTLDDILGQIGIRTGGNVDYSNVS